MIRNQIKKFVFDHPKLVLCLIKILNILTLNRIRKGNNKLQINGLLIGTKISIKGTGNIIIVDDFSRLINMKIYISGDNNTVHIGHHSFLESGEICIEDNNGKVVIGDDTIISKGCHLAEIEGTTISVGNQCLFSAFVTIRTGDSHSILDSANGKRINYSKDVTLGNHIWVGNSATILKGVHVSDDCIIGTNSVVTKSVEPSCAVAGNPAKVIKNNVTWLSKRIIDDV